MRTTGAVVELFTVLDDFRPEAAYRAAFAVIALGIAAGLALYALFYAMPGKR